MKAKCAECNTEMTYVKDEYFEDQGFACFDCERCKEQGLEYEYALLKINCE